MRQTYASHGLPPASLACLVIAAFPMVSRETRCTLGFILSPAFAG